MQFKGLEWIPKTFCLLYLPRLYVWMLFYLLRTVKLADWQVKESSSTYEHFSLQNIVFSWLFLLQIPKTQSCILQMQINWFLPCNRTVEDLSTVRTSDWKWLGSIAAGSHLVTRATTYSAAHYQRGRAEAAVWRKTSAHGGLEAKGMSS